MIDAHAATLDTPGPIAPRARAGLDPMQVEHIAAWLHGFGAVRRAPWRPARMAVAVVYRQGGLIALCALVGAAASLAVSLRVPVSATKPWIQAGRQDEPASRPRIERAGQAASDASDPRTPELVRARADLRHAEDRIVALLAPADGVLAGALKMDPDPQSRSAAGGREPTPAPSAELQLRLDEARPVDAGDAANAAAPDAAPSPLSSVRTTTWLGAELDRLEGARRLAQARFTALRRHAVPVEELLRLSPTAAGRRTAGAGQDDPAPAGRFPLLGPIAGLLLGLLIGGLRELVGDRMRSVREAEQALGVPVLGGLPTLSTQARNGYFGAPAADPAQFA